MAKSKSKGRNRSKNVHRAAMARLEREVKPFTDQVQALAGASSTGDPMRVRFVVTVK